MLHLPAALSYLRPANRYTLKPTRKRPDECTFSRGIVWATLYGLAGHFLSDNVCRLTGPVGIVAIVLAVVINIAFLLFLRRNEHQLEDEAERALPGSPDEYQPVEVRDKQPI